MAENSVSIKVGTDASAAVRDFKKLTDQLHATEAAARRAGGGFQSMASAAEHSLGRIAARAAQARREIEQMSRAGSTRGFGAATGGGFSGGGNPLGALTPGHLAVAGAAIGGIAAVGYQGYRQEAQAEAFLANAARQTGQAYAQQAAEVAKLRRELGLTTAQATELQAATLRFTSIIGRPQDAGKLSRSLANALAGAGRSTSEIPDRLRQLATGQDELFDVLGPVKIGSTYAGSPEAIYKAYAREILHVKRELTDLEKTQARYFAVLQAGEASQGALNERLKSTVGQVDVLTNKVNDLAAAWTKAWVESSGGSRAIGGLTSAVGTADGQGTGLMTAAANMTFYTNPLTGTLIIKDYFDGLTNDLTRGMLSPEVAGNGFAGVPQKFARLGRSILSTFGISGSDSIRGPGRSPLDNASYLGRDPFAFNDYDRTMEANRKYQDRLAYETAREGARYSIGGAIGRVGGAFADVVAYGDRFADYNRSISGESPVERATRVFGLSSRFESTAAQVLAKSGAFTGTEAADLAGAESRKFLIGALGNVRPEDLTADQDRAYREALLRAQEDRLKEAIEALALARKSEAHLKKLADKLAPDGATETPQTEIVITNRADVVARFAQASVSGDAAPTGL